VDEPWAAEDGSWMGRSRLRWRKLRRFRMVGSGYHDGTGEEGEIMTHQDGLRAKLVEYVQNVLLMLDSMIVTTREETVRLLRRHKDESRRQQERLGERLKALGGGPGLVSVGKDLTIQPDRDS